jgi:hypothetical protein
MFFLGLLSTPMPYLLLAAFYFFGFAMGLFNNKTEEEVIETAAVKTIVVESGTSSMEHTAFYYDQYKPGKAQVELSKAVSPFAQIFATDTGPSPHTIYCSPTYDFVYSHSQFSRPPPADC